MASITHRTNKKGISTWQVMVRLKNERPIIQSHPSREAAEKFANEVEKRLRQSLAAKINPYASLPASGNWNEEKLSTTLTLFSQGKACIACHRPIIATLKKTVGEVVVGDLGQDWIEEYIERVRHKNSTIGRPYKLATIARHLVMVNVALKWRARQLKMPKPEFVVDKKVLPRGWDVKRERRLEPGEEQILMTKFRKMKGKTPEQRAQFRLLFRLALETAARLQELVKAEWSEFSIGRKMWNMPAEHTKCAAARKVPLSPAALRIIRLLDRMRAPGNPRVFGSLPAPNLVSCWFHDFTRQAGVKDFRFHDLRHDAIARFVLHPKGYPVPLLMKIVGHKEYSTFERYLTFREEEFKDFMR